MHIPEFEDGSLWPKTGSNQYASEIWTQSRAQNAGTSFELITSAIELKRGDVVVLGLSPISATGHIAFCDEDYSGDLMPLLGQNQVNPSLTTGHIPTVTTLSISAFLGAFRYKAWNPTPPQPTRRSSKFPWVLYAKKLRNKRNGIML